MVFYELLTLIKNTVSYFISASVIFIKNRLLYWRFNTINQPDLYFKNHKFFQHDIQPGNNQSVLLFISLMTALHFNYVDIASSQLEQW